MFSRFSSPADINESIVNTVLSKLKVTVIGGQSYPKDGRIANNIIVDTQELGRIIIRVYPKDLPRKLETGNVQFEVDALTFLSRNMVPVPQPLPFDDSTNLLSVDKYSVFCYKLLPGVTFTTDELNAEVVTKIGHLLSQMTSVATSFGTLLPAEQIPSGDLEYIDDIAKVRMQEYPQLETCAAFQKMVTFNSNAGLRSKIAATPNGLVHADFFHENIIADTEGDLSVIDFGDCYYGKVIMDVAIGAMEFAVQSDEDNLWDYSLFRAFLLPNFKFLKDNNIDCETFLNIMSANCLRFAIYTLPSTLSKGEPIESNPYVRRFNYLQTETAKLYATISFEMLTEQINARANPNNEKKTLRYGFY